MSAGVRGMTLGGENDEVVGMITLNGSPNETVMVVSQNGYGKRSSQEDYPTHNRGGKGVKTINITEKTGELVAIKNVNDKNDLMIINQSGITLRLPVEGIRVMGRATQGVRLIDLAKRGDKIASVCKVDSDPEEEIEEEVEDDMAHVSDKDLNSELMSQERIESDQELEIEENEREDDPSAIDEDIEN